MDVVYAASIGTTTGNLTRFLMAILTALRAMSAVADFLVLQDDSALAANKTIQKLFCCWRSYVRRKYALCVMACIFSFSFCPFYQVFSLAGWAFHISWSMSVCMFRRKCGLVHGCVWHWRVFDEAPCGILFSQAVRRQHAVSHTQACSRSKCLDILTGQAGSQITSQQCFYN